VDGYEATGADLPPERHDVPLGRRRRAALTVLAIGRGHTPEELEEGFPQDVLDAFSDGLELDEALAYVDLLLETLLPRTEGDR
jgi:hypothetical protein